MRKRETKGERLRERESERDIETKRRVSDSEKQKQRGQSKERRGLLNRQIARRSQTDARTCSQGLRWEQATSRAGDGDCPPDSPTRGQKAKLHRCGSP